MLKEVTNYLDFLGECLNFEGFKMRAEQILLENSKETFAFWSFDIKHFKYINDNFGYKEGDRTLKAISNNILSVLEEGELLGRISGDNFVIMVHFISKDDLEKRFNKCMKVIECWSTSNRLYNIETASGVFVCRPEDRTDININQFLDYTNSARKQAKKLKGCHVKFFSEELWNKEKRAIKISQHLSKAIEDGEIQPWFQPQYDYRERKIIGAEVLSRWIHPSYGRIFPDEFIHVLEETGQISKLDYYIWESACKCMRKWLDAGYRMPLSINLSRKDTLGYGSHSRRC